MQDSDPSQNSAAAHCTAIHPPVRSADVHCTENLSHMANNMLKEEDKLKRITKESFREFQERVIRTIRGIPAETINNLILSMNTRVEALIASRGHRIRY